MALRKRDGRPAEKVYSFSILQPRTWNLMTGRKGNKAATRDLNIFVTKYFMIVQGTADNVAAVRRCLHLNAKASLRAGNPTLRAGLDKGQHQGCQGL